MTLAPKRTSDPDRGESGQSLVVVVLALVVIVGLSALAIDVSGWFATHHRAQVAADAAALAAANYMATSDGQGSTSTATGISQKYVSRNGFDGSKAQISFDTAAATVTVTVPTTGSVFFASSVGIGPPRISATAVASWETGTTPYALFADAPCTGANTGITLDLNGHTNLSGVHSNGDLAGQFGNNTTVNLNTLSYGATCSDTLVNGNNAGAPVVSAVGVANPLPYPVPYNSPSCTLSSGVDCYFNPPSPPCTYSASTLPVPPSLASVISSDGTNITITGSVGSAANPVILCAPNGSITVATNNTTFYGTMYASSVDLNGEGITLNPPANQLGIYMTGSGTLDLNPGQGNGKGSNNDTLNNAYIFAPNATVQLGGNNGSGFIEAANITVSGNNWSFAATGPTDPYLFADALVG